MAIGVPIECAVSGGTPRNDSNPWSIDLCHKRSGWMESRLPFRRWLTTDVDTCYLWAIPRLGAADPTTNQ